MQSTYTTPVLYAIVENAGTDCFSIISVYADGSETTPWGSFQTVESAIESVDGSGIDVEDWTA